MTDISIKVFSDASKAIAQLVIRAAAATIRSSAPSRKARIASSAIRIPPLSCTTTSQSSGSRKAG
jgi:hypothetical protein